MDQTEQARETGTEWGVRYLDTGHVECADDEQDARNWAGHDDSATEVVSRTVIYGPWETRAK